MKETAQRGLIQNMGSAIYALCFTGLVAGVSLVDALLRPTQKRDWVDFRIIGPRLDPALSVYFYLCLVGSAVALYRWGRGKERALIAAVFAGILLSPAQEFSPSAAIAINYVHAVGDAVAFLISMNIFLKFRATKGHPSADG